ncbi:MAG: NusA-like transcription termination signal-binding factor [Nanobdellota archaeon]
MRIKYDQRLMKLISLFESRTKVSPKDAFEDAFGLLHFVVPDGKAMKAIGKKGANAKKISDQMNRKIKIVEFSDDRETFIKRLVFPLKVTQVDAQEDVVNVTVPDNQTRSRMIGRNGVNLRNYEDIVKRYFPLKEIKIKE